MPTPNTKKPVRYMDFVSRKPRASSDPLASRPVSRPAQPERTKVEKVRSVSDQIPPKGAHPKPITRPTPEITIRKEETRPLVSRTPASSRDLYPESKEKTSSDEATRSTSATNPRVSKDSAPDNNAYSLGGRSPFIKNYTVDKRPLSSSVPQNKQGESFEKLSYLGVSDDNNHRKNVYPKAEEEKQSDKEGKKKPVRIVDDKPKKKGVPTWLIILFTAILGAAVGAGLYFVLPK